MVPFRISGAVTDDEGRPVVGAKVTIAPWKFGELLPQLILTSDAAGTYRADFQAMRDAVGGVGNSFAEQAGHETHRRYLGPRVPQEITQNFHLYRVRHIAPGDSVALTVRPDDPSCGFDAEWVCRTVRITATRAGTLTIRLTSHSPQDATGLEVIERVPAGVPFRPKCCAPEVTMAVAAGAEVMANALAWWDTKANHSFTLVTSLVE